MEIVSESINSYGKVYLTEEDKPEFESRFHNWFSSKIEIAITFLFSILGTLALIVTVIGCIRNHKLGSLVGAFPSVPQTEARPLDCDPSIINNDYCYQHIIFHVYQSPLFPRVYLHCFVYYIYIVQEVYKKVSLGKGYNAFHHQY